MKNFLPLSPSSCRLRLLALGFGLSLAALSPSAQAVDWLGGSSTWSDAVPSPGWNGSVPNAQGAIGSKTDTTSATITQDIVGGVTLGTFTLGGTSGNAVFQVTLTNPITFDQDGGGAGTATISNTNSGTGTTRISLGTGTMTLADNLLISNTSGSTNTQAISITSTIGGTGNLTIYNVSNSTTVGAINLGGTNTFTGSVLIQKGEVSLANTGFGGSGNAVTLGSSGNGSATLVTTSSNTSIANNITVASGTGGTLLLGSTSNSAVSNSIFSGTLTLNDNVSLTSAKGAGADTRYTGVISGVGSITTVGTGETQFGNASTSITNTYTGNTTLSETSSLVLSDNAKLTFVIGASGVNNKISGTANQTLTLDGDFIFNLSGAASVGAWTIVDVATVNETFSSLFTVVGFTQNADVWTMTSGAQTYTFTEATGVLSAIPEPQTWAMMVGGLGMLLLVQRRRRAVR